MTTSLFEQYKAALRRGHLAVLAGELEVALTAYEEAGRLVPERALPLASRGAVLHRLDRWPEAVAALDQALQLAPDDEAALRARATARAERGLRTGAAADFERLAFVLDVAGRSREAAEAARQAADLEPSAPRRALADRLGAAAAQGAVPATGVAAAQRFASTTPADAASFPVQGPPDVDRGSGTAGEGDEAAREGGPSATPQTGRDSGIGTAQDAGEPAATTASAAATEAAATVGDEQAWPGIDLPSPPPPPVDGTLDPEALLADAALVLEAGEVEAARDLMLTAARIHREAARIDAALETCLNLLSIAPGDPAVHLAIANLQLDRGWTPVATEKLDLLVRLTSLTGDTQAAADVHGLASERLRDGPVADMAGG